MRFQDTSIQYFFRVLTSVLGEIVRLEEELKDTIQEAGKRVNMEVTKVKNLYKDKLREANVEIEFLRTVSNRYKLKL